MSVSKTRSPERAAIVELPTWTQPSYVQTIVGKTSPLSADLEEFRGIPYGIVNGRWEHSQLRTSLPQDIYDATKNGPKCPQPEWPNNSQTFQSYLEFPPDVTESEFDCLNLFVIRPSAAALARQGLTSGAKLPVLVWIHGGGFGFGAGTDPMWDPSHLVLRSLQNGTPIVAACLNYRLGLFGFASSADLLAVQEQSEIRGLNFGLYDQKVGLAWISRNIAHFGGDPEQVTIGGQSAGSVSIHAHLLDADGHQEKPLFQKALLHAGALVTAGPRPLVDLEPDWEKLVQYWGLESEAKKERVELLRRISASDLLESAAKLRFITFGIVADDVNVDMRRDITLAHVDRRRANKSADYKPIEVFLGNCDFEGIGFFNESMSFETTKQIFKSAYTDTALVEEVMASYGFVESATPEELKVSLGRFISDSMFDFPMFHARSALIEDRIARFGTADSIQPFHIEFGNPFPGRFHDYSHHCLDLIYVFDAFHNALADADKGIINPYPALPEGQKPVLSDGKYTRSNIELAYELQDQWLGFIVGKPVHRVGEDEILVWGKDRSTRVDKMTTEPRWIEKKKRFDLLRKDIDAMGAATRAIRALR
ncbi:para-nitrobenzyl esterase [Xylariales sp. PMI_506]|nr:para-nitrobenzyl esterase [Xylariales sp. PMI_506]